MAHEIALQEGLGIPSLPVVPTTLPITITRPRTQEQVEAARQELIPRQELATSARSDIRTIQEAWQAEKRKIERKALGEREIDLLKLEKERPIPKELPTFESPKKTFDELFSVLMVGAMTASGAGKSNFMAAANSMIGAMEGYQKGKKNEFDQAVKEFDISLKKALQEEKINNAKYQQIWASKKLTIQEKFNQTMLQADAAQDKITAAIARLGDVDKLERRIADKEKELKSIDDARIRAEERINEIKQRSADRDARIAAARLAGRTAQTWEVTDEQGKKRNISVMPQYDRQGRQTNEPAGGVLLGTGARAGAAAAAARVPKEITLANSHRNIVIPDLEEAIPILDRLHEEKKWNTLTTLLAVDPRLAEAKYKDDPEAISLIRILAKFRSSEFETAGKALTRKEDEILKPLYRADLRVYEAVRNSMTKGLREMKAQQRALEAQYPSLKEENQVIREMRESSPSVTTPATAPAAPATEPAVRKVMPGEEKLMEYANQHFGGNVENARKYLKSLGYE